MKGTMLAAPLAVLASFIHVAHAVQPARQPKLRVLGTYDGWVAFYSTLSLGLLAVVPAQFFW